MVRMARAIESSSVAGTAASGTFPFVERSGLRVECEVVTVAVRVTGWPGFAAAFADVPPLMFGLTALAGSVGAFPASPGFGSAPPPGESAETLAPQIRPDMISKAEGTRLIDQTTKKFRGYFRPSVGMTLMLQPVSLVAG